MSTAVERVQEYLRQRKPQSRDLGNVIHNIWTDSKAEMASLTIEDLETVLADVWAEGAQDASLHWGAPEVGTAELLKDNPYSRMKDSKQA